MIADSSSVIVIGEEASLGRLRERIAPGLLDHVEFQTPDALLVDFNTRTADGEARLREMERLYARLRNKVLVRLLVTNLNDENRGRYKSLQDICDEWDEIQTRRCNLLKEAKNEGISFVTVVVTEEGEWHWDDKHHLELLSGEQIAQETVTARHRCYLITRMLELGQGDPIHATDAWPILVASLLEFFWLMSGSQSSGGKNWIEVLGDPGLYTWRTLRVVADISEAALDETTRQVFDSVHEVLLQPNVAALFSTALESNSDRELADECIKPAPVATALERLAATRWHGLRELGLLRDILAQDGWREVTNAFALGVRAHLRLSRSRDVEPELTATKSRMDSARKVPGHVFPGALAGSPGRTTSAHLPLADLRAVTDGLAAVARARQRLQDAWEQHTLAANAFVTWDQRWLIGLVLGVALSYAAIMLSVVSGSVLPEGTTSWIDGVWIALWGTAGVVTMLYVGYTLQRKRGEHAKENTLERLAADYVKKEEEVRARLAAVLRRAGDRGRLLRRQAARRLLHERLSRAEVVLSNEIQPLGANRSGRRDPRPDLLERNLRRLVECRIETRVPGLSEEDREKLVKWAQDQFLQHWESLLAQDSRAIGFLPAIELIRMASVHAQKLRTEVLQKLLEKAMETLLLDRDKTDIALLEEALSAAELNTMGKSARLYSVDLGSYAEPITRVWTHENLHTHFTAAGVKQVYGFPGRKAPFDSSALIALWHGEVQLEMNKQSGLINFEQLRKGAGA